MLTQIKAGAAAGSASLADALQAGDAGDAVDLLLGCHTRIRHFTAVAVKLSRPDAPRAEVAHAAQAVYRYYSVALPLHEADENQSVYPRLRAALPPGALAEANQAMVDQHKDIDAIIAALLPRWQELPTRPDLAPASGTDAERLQEAWRTHLELEEQVIFPALRAHLGEADRAAIRREMGERRRIPPSATIA